MLATQNFPELLKHSSRKPCPPGPHPASSSSKAQGASRKQETFPVPGARDHWETSSLLINKSTTYWFIFIIFFITKVGYRYVRKFRITPKSLQRGGLLASVFFVWLFFSPGWPSTLSCLPASAPQTLGLQACATMSYLVYFEVCSSWGPDSFLVFGCVLVPGH